MTETPPVTPSAPDADPAADTGGTPIDLGANAPADPPADPPSVPAKKAAKKAPAKKAAASPPKADKPNGSLYLPALPEGFAYNGVTIVGPNGEFLSVTPTDDGKAQVRIESNDLDKTSDHPDMKHALGAASRKAKAMSDLAKREKELAALRAEAFDS